MTTPVITAAPKTWPIASTRCYFRGKLMDYETAAGKARYARNSAQSAVLTLSPLGKTARWQRRSCCARGVP